MVYKACFKLTIVCVKRPREVGDTDGLKGSSTVRFDIITSPFLATGVARGPSTGRP